MSEHGEDERAVGEDCGGAQKVLARVAEDRTLLAGVDAQTRTMLQKLAGEVARPDLKRRKKLQRAILRRERDARRARDEALRRAPGSAAPGGAGLPDADPELPPAGTDASGWWPALPGPDAAPPPDAAAAPEVGRRRPGSPSRASATSARRRTTGSTLHHDQLCRPCGDDNFARRTAAVDLGGRVALVTGARA